MYVYKIKDQTRMLWGARKITFKSTLSYNLQIYFCFHLLTFPWWKVSKNQGSFQGIFYFILFRKTVRKYFPARSLSLKKRNAITKKFTINSMERPFQLHFEINLNSDWFFWYFTIVSPQLLVLIQNKANLKHHHF